MSDYKLVPFEPTPEMVEAAEKAHMPFGDMDLAIRMAILAAPAVQGEPVAYAAFSSNGNILWCADPLQVETLRQEYGEALQPLYTAPQSSPCVTQLVEALERIKGMDSMSYHSLETAQLVAKLALAAYRKQGGGA